MFKGERIGSFRLDYRLGTCPEGQLWKVRADDGGAGTAVLYYNPQWVGRVREVGIPLDMPEHPRVWRLIGSDLETHRPWVVWSHGDEDTLADLLAGRIERETTETEGATYLALPRAMPLIYQIAEGLEAIHAAGAAHLDLRPGTVFLDEEGRVSLARPKTAAHRGLLLDLAKELGGDVEQELKHYQPPEQRRRQFDAPAAADMYAFGLLAFRLLTGTAPDPFELRHPSARDRRIPKVFDEVVMAALERPLRARLANAVGLPEVLAAGIRKAGFSFAPSEAAPATWVQGEPA